MRQSVPFHVDMEGHVVHLMSQQLTYVAGLSQESYRADAGGCDRPGRLCEIRISIVAV